MKIFSALYEWTLKWAEHKFAPRILALLTFAESVFFPIPPDVLLAPMVLAQREKAWRFAALTTVASVIGGVVGYGLGYTVSAGFLHMAFLPFLLASAIGRGMRFFLVAGVIRWGGAPMEQKIRQWVDVLGWLVVSAIVIAYIATR